MDLALETHPATVRQYGEKLTASGNLVSALPPTLPIPSPAPRQEVSRKRKLGHTGGPRWQEAQGHTGRGHREVPSVGQS